MIEQGNAPIQQDLRFSHAETKKTVEGLVQQEMELSEDTRYVEEGVYKLIERIRSGKLVIKAYKSGKS